MHHNHPPGARHPHLPRTGSIASGAVRDLGMPAWSVGGGELHRRGRRLTEARYAEQLESSQARAQCRRYLKSAFGCLPCSFTHLLSCTVDALS